MQSPPASTQRFKGTTILKGMVVLLAIWISGASLYGVIGGWQSPVFKNLLNLVPWAGSSHVVFGSVALVIGGFQMSSRIRRKNLSLHMLVGRTYVVCVLLSTVGAVVSLPSSPSAWAAKSAFWILAIAWPVATLAGYPKGRPFDSVRHAKFMMYSYAMTCAAISLRILLGIQLALGFGFEIAYPVAAWGGFLGNLLIAQLIILILGFEKIAESQELGE